MRIRRIGFVDVTDPSNPRGTGTVSVSGINTEDDGVIDLAGSITDTLREPDAIGWINDTTLATANEGDWKGGTRSWTVFDVDGNVVWDAGNSFKHLAI